MRQRGMLSLRLAAIVSNLLFVAFGYVEHIYPVLFLHVILLPINSWRLSAVWRASHPRRTITLGSITNRGGLREREVAESRR